MMKKIFLFLVVTLLATLILTACGGNDTGSPEGDNENSSNISGDSDEGDNQGSDSTTDGSDTESKDEGNEQPPAGSDGDDVVELPKVEFD